MTLQLERETVLTESVRDQNGSHSAILLANIPGIGQRVHIRMPYRMYQHLAGKAGDEQAEVGSLLSTSADKYFATRMRWKFLTSTSTGDQDQCYFESTSHCGPDGEPILFGTSRESLWDKKD